MKIKVGRKTEGKCHFNELSQQGQQMKSSENLDEVILKRGSVWTVSLVTRVVTVSVNGKRGSRRNGRIVSCVSQEARTLCEARTVHYERVKQRRKRPTRKTEKTQEELWGGRFITFRDRELGHGDEQL